MPVNQINGTDDGETIRTSIRNDLVLALGGDDRIIANAGGNTYDGGDGYDYLSYAERTVAGTTALHGAVINYATMLVLNPWGRQDVLNRVEQILGSMFDDAYQFKGGAPLFQIGQGLAGADTFSDEVGSNTWLLYREDDDFGGLAGITVRLGSVSNIAGDVRGTVTDGFGDTDQVSMVHRVEGTARNDRFFGSVLNDHFNGLGGRDFFNGGGGRDSVYLDNFPDAPQRFAIEVDLALNGGEIINDGFGHTETATSIEGILGSLRRDSIRGDAGANFIAGGGGEDRLAGRGGADDFVYGFFLSGDEFGDVIQDFKSGTDKFVLTDIATGNVVLDAIRFTNSSVAGSADQACFFFDAALHTLFLDIDGADGLAPAVGIARLIGVTAMTAHDIQSVDFFDYWG